MSLENTITIEYQPYRFKIEFIIKQLFRLYIQRIPSRGKGFNFVNAKQAMVISIKFQNKEKTTMRTIQKKTTIQAFYNKNKSQMHTRIQILIAGR